MAILQNQKQQDAGVYPTVVMMAMWQNLKIRGVVAAERGSLYNATSAM